MSGSGNGLGVYWLPLESFDDRERYARCDRMRAEIALGVTHATPTAIDALDLLRSFRASARGRSDPTARNRRRVQGFHPSPYRAEVSCRRPRLSFSHLVKSAAYPMALVSSGRDPGKGIASSISRHLSSTEVDDKRQ